MKKHLHSQKVTSDYPFSILAENVDFLKNFRKMISDTRQK